MAKEFIREIKGRQNKYLTYWDRVEKKSKQKYLGGIDIEKTIILKHKKQLSLNVEPVNWQLPRCLH